MGFEYLGSTLHFGVPLDVHMTTLGSYPRYDNSYEDDLRALKWRYDNWTPNNGLGQEFDRAMYDLIKTVLREAEGK